MAVRLPSVEPRPRAPREFHQRHAAARRHRQAAACRAAVCRCAKDAGSLPRAVARFPSLLWLFPSGRTGAGIWAVGVAGAAAAAAVAVPGLWLPTWALFTICWLCWLSFVNAFGSLFWFPWDKLTCEIAFLGIFLPNSGHTPAAQTRLLFQLLLFRVMFGMALAKFRKLDDRSRNLTYIYHFLEWQPFPTSAARTLRDAMPMLLHKASFVLFGIIELVLPFVSLFAQGTIPRRVCFAGLVGLQCMIMWTGNFGCFNIATAALCWPLLADLDMDAPRHSSPGQSIGAPFVNDWWSFDSLAWSLVAIHTIISVPFLLHTTSWDHGIASPSVTASMVDALTLAEVLRALEPLRLWNSYGVFISRGNVPHQVPVLQMQQARRTRGLTSSPTGSSATLTVPRAVLPRTIRASIITCSTPTSSRRT